MHKENPTFTKQNPFIRKCVYALSHVNLESDIRSRCIGGNNEISETICNLIIRGEKIGTFSLPWLHQKYPNTQSQIGEFIVQTNYDGVPRALVQVISLKILFFGEIGEKHSALDGPRMRDLGVWSNFHTKYWNSLLKPLGKSVTCDTPVIVERFFCHYPVK